MTGKIIKRNKVNFFESFGAPKKIFKIDLEETGTIILI